MERRKELQVKECLFYQGVTRGCRQLNKSEDFVKEHQE